MSICGIPARELLAAMVLNSAAHGNELTEVDYSVRAYVYVCYSAARQGSSGEL